MTHSGRFGIYGASGFGKEVAALRRDRIAVFVDDALAGSMVTGSQVVTLQTFCAQGGEEIAIAIADSGIRRLLAQRCAAAGLRPATIVAANAFVGSEVTLGEGAIVCAFCALTSSLVVGRHFQCNIYSYVAHDCIIGDYVTFAPNVACNGNVTIGEGAYIGTSAILRQGIAIGAGATIGMGSVVTKNVPANETWVGNPARPMVRD